MDNSFLMAIVFIDIITRKNRKIYFFSKKIKLFYYFKNEEQDIEKDVKKNENENFFNQR